MASLLSKIGAVYRIEPVGWREAHAIARCEGKEGFESPSLAAAVGARMLRAKGEPTQHYRCTTCGMYHLGSRQR